ncbi:MAG: outer membrane protein transport protein [Verrucomicrobiota bacterium]
MNIPTKLRVSVVAILTLAGVGSAFAAGFDLPSQDAFAIARGQAFIATADNPSAIYYNPAGIAQLKGNNLRGGIYAIYLDPNYESPSQEGKTFHNQDKLNGVPELFYTYSSENCPVHFGLGIYSPFGLSVRWPDTTGFRTVGTRGSLKYLTFNPVVAMEVLPNFMLGGGVTVNYANVDLRQGLFSPNTDSDEFRFRGDGWDVGYNLGALWKVCEQISLGTAFHSSTRVGLNGHTAVRNDVLLPGPIPPFSQRRAAEADFSFPLKASAGISYRPTPKWNLEFNAEYVDWDELGQVTIRQSAANAVLPKDIPLTLNWQSSWYYEFGATRYLDNGWHISAGYILNENSVPDANYTPVVADLDRHFFSIGTGFVGKRFDFDIAYQFGYGPGRNVKGSAPSAIGQTADGKYGFLSHAIAASVGLHF